MPSVVELSWCGNVFSLYRCIEEYRCGSLEFVHIFGGEEVDCAVFCTRCLYFGVTEKVAGKAFRHYFALCHDVDSVWCIVAYLVDEQWVVRAAEYDGVDTAVLREEVIDVFLDEVVGSCAVMLVVFYERNPHRARLSDDLYIREELFRFQRI